jgi:hypothetical protein
MLSFGLTIRVWGAALASLALAATAVVAQTQIGRDPDVEKLASCQGPPIECMRLASRYWFETFMHKLKVATSEYNEALDRFQRAERTKRPEIIAAAKRDLDLKAEKLQSAKAWADTFTSLEVKRDFQANFEKVKRQFDDARTRLANYEAAWNRLQTSERSAALREIEAIRKEAESRREETMHVFHTATHAAVYGLGELMGHPPAALQKVVSPGTLAAMKELGPKLKGGTVGWSLAKWNDHTTLERFLTVMEATATGLAAFKIIRPEIATAVALGPAYMEVQNYNLKTLYGAVTIAAAFSESYRLRAAEQRLSQIGNETAYWKERIAIARSEAFHLSMRLQYAGDLREMHNQVAERARNERRVKQ